MATVVARTDFSQVKQTGVTTYTVNLTQATAAGNKLVLVAWGGARVTAKITNGSGAAFTSRTEALGAQAVSIQDFTAIGGETAVFITLNGAENIAVTVYEINGLGAFIAASNNGTGVTNSQAGDFQAKPTSSINLGANANALLVGAWSVNAAFGSSPFNAGNQWRQMGPLGKLYVNAAIQPSINTEFIYATGLADVTNTSRYPADLASAGDYRATSVFNGTNAAFAAQAAYADTSGVPTNPAPANANVAENSLPGTHSQNWYLGNNGTNATIAGYTDKTSYLPGDTVSFKVDSTNNPFRVEIYRLGYYGYEFFGARLQTGNGSGYITGAVVTQSAPTVDSTLGSPSCAWTTNATWTIPTTAAPGVYYVIFRRTDATSNFASGHFVVRSASAKGKVAVVIPDMTHQAYNVWGATTDNGPFNTGSWSGRSFYAYGPDGTNNFAHRAYGVSFDRPYGTQSMQNNTYMFDSEYGLNLFLEAQGYDLVYYSDVDLENNPTLLNNAALVIVNGHHEYWTTNVYDCLKNAADAGVNMMFNSSNTAGWHVRFAAGDTNKRTVICYKDSGTQDVSAGWTGTGFDPVTYSGSWRDSRTGGSVNNTDVRRENALTGQLFMFSAPVALDMTVPFAQKTLPIWRNSSSVQALTSGQTYTTPVVVVGQELDAPDGSTGQPSNLVNLCPTPTGTLTTGANAAGTTYNTSTSTTAGFTLYRRSSGALIFNTGSWRGWNSVSRWRITNFVTGSPSVDANWQNALLALLYDLGVAPTVARELEPANDPVLTNPAIGAPAGGRSGTALAYGLRAPEDGNFTPFTGQ